MADKVVHRGTVSCVIFKGPNHLRMYIVAPHRHLYTSKYWVYENNRELAISMADWSEDRLQKYNERWLAAFKVVQDKVRSTPPPDEVVKAAWDEFDAAVEKARKED